MNTILYDSAYTDKICYKSSSSTEWTGAAKMHACTYIYIAS